MAALQEKQLDYNFIFTGQHQETIAQLRKNFGLKEPDVMLYQGKDITGLLQMFFWMLRILFKTIFYRRQIYKKQGSNDIVLVHGDTFSTLLGALMGKVAGKNVGHIESGLRSFNLFHPFPEEITRILTFGLTDYYFCPGDWALQNLEKYQGIKINTKHNTLLDSLKLAKKKTELCNVEVPDEPFALVSLHRFENIFNRKIFRFIVNSLLEISQKIKLVFILHPPTKEKLKSYNLDSILRSAGNISLRPRYDYFNFIRLLINCEFLITDGGSNQEEAYYLGKPTILFRRITERKEGVGENAVISNFDSEIIRDFVSRYQDYVKSPLEPEISPTEIILSSLEEFDNAN